MGIKLLPFGDDWGLLLRLLCNLRAVSMRCSKRRWSCLLLYPWLEVPTWGVIVLGLPFDPHELSLVCIRKEHL